MKLADLVSEYLDGLIAGRKMSAESFAALHEDQGPELLQLLTYLELFRNEHKLPELEDSRADLIWRHIRDELVHQPAAEMKLDQRPDMLILLLYFANQIWGNTKLVKLLFLLGKEGKCDQYVPDFYGHYAYNFGAFDKNVPKDVEGLVKTRLVQKTLPPTERVGESEDIGMPNKKRIESIYKLTSKGRRFAELLVDAAKRKDPKILAAVKDVLAQHGNKTADELLAYTYRNYPEYASRSLVRDQYLPPKNEGGQAQGD